MCHANVNVSLIKDNVIQIKDEITILMRVKKYHICGKVYIWNPTTCSCENEKYLASIIDNPVITYDEMINAEAKSNNMEISTNFN